MRQTLAWLENPYAFLDRHIEQNQLSFRLTLPGSSQSLMTGDPDLIEEILHNKNLIGGKGLRFVQPFVGPRALIVISGQEHLLRRQPIMKMFFQNDNPWMRELTSHYFDQEAKLLNQNETFSLVAFYERIALRVILDYVLGVHENENRELYKLFHTWMNSFQNPFWIFLKPLQRKLGRLTPWQGFVENREAIWVWLETFLKKAEFNDKSVIASLIRERAEGVFVLSDQDLIWQCIELILFGHDTTACGVAWTVTHLIESDLIGSERLKTLEFREASVQEALRITPMVIHVTREATADTTVGPFRIKQGQKVFPCAYLAHHQEKIFKNHKEFQPERFLEANPKTSFRNSYFPFGIGQRLCVGMPFALSQMELLLRKTLELGRLKKVFKQKTRAKRKFIIMAPENGGQVYFDSPITLSKR